MDLTNEVHFSPVLFYNTNLDPTRRYGSETSLFYRVNDALLLRSGMAYPGGFPRGHLDGQRRAAGVALHGECRHHLEYLAELSAARCHRALLERAAHGQ